MGDQLKLDYFYGDEPDHFCFYRIPKVLFTKACFEDLSTDAKVLYGLMLDMMSSSRNNRWLDKENRVFIQFSIQRAMAYLKCGKDKAIKLFAELDIEKGIGLIERIDRGQGKADLIYVKSFEVDQDAEDNERIKKLKERKMEKTLGQNVQRLHVDNSPKVVGKTDQFENGDWSPEDKVVVKFDQSEKPTTYLEEKVVGKTDRSDYQTSRGPDFRPQEVGFSDPNKNNMNKTDHRDSGLSYPIRLRMARCDEDPDETEGQSKKQQYISMLRRQVRYDELMADERYRNDQEMIDGLINMVADIAAYPKPSGTEWINSREIPYQVVKSRLTKMDYDIITYAIDSLKENSTEIRNKRAYLLTTVYNAQDERQFSYTARVNHDMFGGGWRDKGVI